MRDPVPAPSPFLVNLAQPIADFLSFPTLPYHIHEVLFALVFYQTIQSVISPVLSSKLFPSIYPQLKPRTRLNWDVHVVSLVQSCLINTLALWVMFKDDERAQMSDSAVERVYGYTGSLGMIQGLATGYFLWDLVVSTRYINIFGPGIWAHAVTALMVFSFGFRPFCNYYGPNFLLYELSSPFLNIHWFCDKLNLTGSKLQWYNGMLLLATFFGCRLIWGTYSSIRVYQDVWTVLHMDGKTFSLKAGLEVAGNRASSIFASRDGQMCLGQAECVAAQSEVMKFASADISSVPVWLCAIYLVSNTTLNSLNFYWFGKMVETVRKRFNNEPHDEFKNERDDRRRSVVEEAATNLDHDVLSGPKTPFTEKINPIEAVGVATGVQELDGEVKRRY